MTRFHHVLLFLISMASFIIQGCGTKSTDLHGYPDDNKVSANAVNSAPITTPKVDIVFVVDNSGSMAPFQEKLARNIELFANEFFDNILIDYRIGVVPVYDSKYLNDKTNYTHSGYRQMNPLGELVPLKGLSEKDSLSHPVFVTPQTDNPKQVLKDTVMIGTQWGPEAEESFSPVLALTNNLINTQKNQGFYRPEAHLAVIFLTDADDVSMDAEGQPISAEAFYDRLKELKGEKFKPGPSSKVLIAAAIMSPSSRTSPECRSSTETGAGRQFPRLLARSAGIFADLCSEGFGSTLASFGKLLAEKVAEQRVRLDLPDMSTLKVTYGPPENKEAEVLSRDEGDYYFDSKSSEVVISSNYRPKKKHLNGSIWVWSRPIDPRDFTNGHATSL